MTRLVAHWLEILLTFLVGVCSAVLARNMTKPVSSARSLDDQAHLLPRLKVPDEDDGSSSSDDEGGTPNSVLAALHASLHRNEPPGAL